MNDVSNWNSYQILEFIVRVSLWVGEILAIGQWYLLPAFVDWWAAVWQVLFEEDKPEEILNDLNYRLIIQVVKHLINRDLFRQPQESILEDDFNVFYSINEEGWVPINKLYLRNLLFHLILYPLLFRGEAILQILLFFFDPLLHVIKFLLNNVFFDAELTFFLELLPKFCRIHFCKLCFLLLN